LDDNVIGRTTINPSNAVEGTRLIIGNKQVEVKFALIFIYALLLAEKLIKLILDYRATVTKTIFSREES